MHNIKISYIDFSFPDTKDTSELLKPTSRKSLSEALTCQNYMFFVWYTVPSIRILINL